MFYYSVISSKMLVFIFLSTVQYYVFLQIYIVYDHKYVSNFAPILHDNIRPWTTIRQRSHLYGHRITHDVIAQHKRAPQRWLHILWVKLLCQGPSFHKSSCNLLLNTDKIDESQSKCRDCGDPCLLRVGKVDRSVIPHIHHLTGLSNYNGRHWWIIKHGHPQEKSVEIYISIYICANVQGAF